MLSTPSTLIPWDMNIVINVIHIYCHRYPHSYPKDVTVMHMNIIIIHNLSTNVHKYERSLLTRRFIYRTNKNGNRQNSTISIIPSLIP